MIKRLFCLFGRHTISRNHVWHDSMYFRTRCRVCNTELVRLSGGWSRFDENKHADPRRLPDRHALKA